MAISLPNMVLPLPGYGYDKFRSKKPAPSPLLGRNNRFQVARRTILPVVITNAISKTDGSMASIITELDRGQQEEEAELTTGSTERRLADCWREIQGKDDWTGMLDPIDPLLRSELIRYGDMTQACYDSFDFDPFSKYCGSCRFNRRRFFESLGLSSLGYDVSRYVYATANIKLPNFFKKSRCPKVWSELANWIGYVAVSNDETSVQLGRRDITIAWRGTVTRLEWIADLMTSPRPVSEGKIIPCPDPMVKAESGFLDLYTDKDENCVFCKYSAREQIVTEVRKLIKQYPNEELSITVIGHSLGAALAVLSAYDIVETGLNRTEDGRAVPVSVFSFSGPRVGNLRFKERVEELGLKVLRVVNVHDTVPKVPGLVLNEHVPKFVQRMTEGMPWFYAHVGVELELDHKVSPFLSDTNDIANYHNLEAHLHLLDGYHGKHKKYEPTTQRDIALVNKSADFLKDCHLIPPSWRQDENRGMVRDNEGRWIQPERPKLDDHPPDMHHHIKELGLASDS